MEKNAIDLVKKHKKINIKIEEKAKAYLLIEVDGNNLENLYKDCESINELLKKKHNWRDIVRRQ